jgi:hypothetical protein
MVKKYENSNTRFDLIRLHPHINSYLPINRPNAIIPTFAITISTARSHLQIPIDLFNSITESTSVKIPRQINSCHEKKEMIWTREALKPQAQLSIRYHLHYICLSFFQPTSKMTAWDYHLIINPPWPLCPLVHPWIFQSFHSIAVITTRAPDED